MPNLDAIVRQIEKKYGEGSVVRGDQRRLEPELLPSGIFPIDYAIGGGFPINQITVMRGPEHGGKTTTAMSLVAAVSRMCWRCFNYLEFCTCSLPAMKQVSFWCDAEGTFNRMWAESVGCISEDYYVDLSDNGLVYGDKIGYALKSDNCGLVVLDSVGAIISSVEFEGSLEDTQVAQQAKMVTSLIKKTNNQLIIEAKRGHRCLVVVLAQIRRKIGVLYGSNEETPGGEALKHLPAVRLRVSKVAMQDKAKYYSKERDFTLASRHSVTMEKVKHGQLADSAEFIRARANIPDLGAKKGMVLDHKTVMKYAMMCADFPKDNGNIEILGKKAKQGDFIEFWKANPNFYYACQREVISRIKDGYMNNAESQLQCMPTEDMDQE